MPNHDELRYLCHGPAVARGRRRGVAGASFLLVLLLLLFAMTVMTGELLDLRLKGRMVEEGLRFDYRLEGLYLLMLSGEVVPLEGTTLYVPESLGGATAHAADTTFIRCVRTGEGVLLEGVLEGMPRGRYFLGISKEEAP